MNDDTKDRVLREAGMHLTRAMRVLDESGYHQLSHRTLELSNRILRTRRGLRVTSARRSQDPVPR